MLWDELGHYYLIFLVCLPPPPSFGVPSRICQHLLLEPSTISLGAQRQARALLQTKRCQAPLLITPRLANQTRPETNRTKTLHSDRQRER